MSLGNDLWLDYNISSINGCNNWARDMAQGAPRVDATGQRFSTKIHPNRNQEKITENCQLPDIPKKGLFDDYYTHSMHHRQLMQLANRSRFNNRCRLGAFALPSSSRWITVCGFPLHKRDIVLQFFVTLGPVCDRRLTDGNCFHLCYANVVDCLRAEQMVKWLPFGICVNVQRWKDDPPQLLNDDNRCGMDGTFLKQAVHKHWGREILEPETRYNSYIIS